MKRGDYLNTIKGQISLRWRRQCNELRFHLDGHEPKSKNGISQEEKSDFQCSILEKLKTSNRRHYRKAVALEFDFFPAENDPPAIHNLPKNYLDLLSKPVDGARTKRQYILFRDDRQVSYLAVRYHIATEKKNTGIWIRTAPYRDFLAELKLLNMIHLDAFQPLSDTSWLERESLSWDELNKEDNNDVFFDTPMDRLLEHEREKSFWISRFGEEVYESWRQMYLMDLQQHMLKTLALTPDRLVHLMTPLFSDTSVDLRTDIQAELRKLLISSPLTIDLRHSDLKEGESSEYKQFVRQAIASFRQRYKRLFPLRAQVGVTVLFQPPAVGNIDLDNLARRIVPFVNDELKPPSCFALSIDAASMGPADRKQWYEEKLASVKRMPKFSITHYQVVLLPRLKGDDKHGFVRLILEPGEPFGGLWGKTEEIVERWQESAER